MVRPGAVCEQSSETQKRQTSRVQRITNGRPNRSNQNIDSSFSNPARLAGLFNRLLAGCMWFWYVCLHLNVDEKQIEEITVHQILGRVILFSIGTVLAAQFLFGQVQIR